MSGPRPVRAPRGTEISCKGWPQEAAMRMLMNNLDPEVAEHPDQLVVYGGSGRAARSWDAFDAIVRTLKSLEGDETLVVQSGKPVGVFRTHEWAPRVLIANANLVPNWATPDEFRRLAAAVYWAIMRPELTPGSTARNGGSPWERTGSRIRSTLRSAMAPTSAAAMARKSQAKASGSPWKFPVDSTRPSARTTGLSTADRSSRSATSVANRQVSRAAPVTWGAQRIE